VTITNSASPEIIWGLGGPGEDHQLHHCCWTGRVSEREEGEEDEEAADRHDHLFSSRFDINMNNNFNEIY